MISVLVEVRPASTSKCCMCGMFRKFLENTWRITVGGMARDDIYCQTCYECLYSALEPLGFPSPVRVPASLETASLV